MIEHELIDGLSTALGGIPGAAVTHTSFENQDGHGNRPDAMLVLSLPNKHIDLVVETMRTAYPRDVREKIWQMQSYLHNVPNAGDDLIAMVVAQTISKGARSLLKEAGIGYYDESGSLFLPAAAMYVLVDRPPLPKSRKLREAIFKGKRAQVLHQLFEDPDAWASVKEIAKHAGISSATVSETLSELERREWVRAEGNGPSKRRKLSAKSDLLDAWTQFILSQAPIEAERFYVPKSEIEDLMLDLNDACQSTGLSYAITGDVAAQLYSPYLSNLSRVTCRMAVGPKRHKALEKLNARPVSDGWNFAILPTAGKNETIRSHHVKQVHLAPPLQVYLDLLQSGGRSKEMAQHLRETTLRA